MTDYAIPKGIYYTQTHEWIRMDDKNIATIGITDFVQHNLGEIVFVELPDLEQNIHAGDDICVVESVKTSSDIYSPLSGKITSVNHDLDDAPSLINSDPYGDGWLFKITLKDATELQDLLSTEDYKQYILETEE